MTSFYFPDNLIISDSRIYHVTNPTNGTSRLIIKTTLDEDIGTYSVKLTGPGGQTTSGAKLVPAGRIESFLFEMEFHGNFA